MTSNLQTEPNQPSQLSSNKPNSNSVTNGISDMASKAGPSKVIDGINHLKTKGEKIIRNHVPSTASLGNYIGSIHNSLNTNPLDPSMNYWLVGYKACEKLAMPLLLLWNGCPTPMVKGIVSLAIASVFWIPMLLFFWTVLVPGVTFLSIAYLVLFGFQKLQLHLEETLLFATGLTFKAFLRHYNVILGRLECG